jgi:hypothetical protein
VDVCLKGDFKGEIAGRAIRFRNSRFEDDDQAGHALGDMDIPHIGEVGLISFDPHPNLAPHPYIEWFSIGQTHYRIELHPDEAWILSEQEAAEFDEASRVIRNVLSRHLRSTRDRTDAEWI